MNKIIKNRKTWLVSMSLCAMMFAGCNNNQATQENTTPADSNSTADTTPLNIKIATESGYKPFSYTDSDGNLVGFEIDLANALCEQMQASSCEIVAQDWDGLIPGLNTQKFDAIMAGMSITDERSQVVDFSDPYFNNALVLIGKKGDTVSIDSLDGKSVAAQRSTVASQYLADNYPKVNVKLYDTQDNAYLDLKAGRAEVMLSDKVPAMDWLKTEAGADYEVKGDAIDPDDVIAIAFRKQDPLVGKFNTALGELKENGKYQQIADKYFSTEN